MMLQVLLATDNADLRNRLKRAFAEHDVIVDSVRRTRKLWEHLSKHAGDLLVVTRNLIPEPAPETVRYFRDAPDAPDIIVIVPEENAEERALFLAAGAEAVLPVSLDSPVLEEILSTILEKRRAFAAPRLTRLKADQPRLADFVSASPVMQVFLQVVERVADSDTSLLVLGETGVGKERLARAMHSESRRTAGPFIAINCGALPESLLESELFGHEEGAFTGANRARRGWFELAHEGTVFLDEIGEMAPHLQVKLLRVLQEREVQRIGSEKAIPVNVRVMAATNRNLEEDVEAGDFRRDLFYRLSVVTLTLPPLRERREDIPALVENYIDYFQSTIGRSVDGIDPSAMEALVRYAWPGNVRELANAIERAVLLAAGPRIGLHDLPENIRGRTPILLGAVPSTPGETPQALDTEAWLDRPLPNIVDDLIFTVEKKYLEAALRRTMGRVGRAAELAGITTRSLFEKMRKYGLRKEDFKEKGRGAGME